MGEWRTLVRMQQDAISGQSYQLALALADRIARGRDFCGTGKVIASGQMMPLDASLPDGRVIEVEGIAAKCQLITSHLQAGMRILLPAASSTCVPQDFLAKVQLAGGVVGLWQMC